MGAPHVLPKPTPSGALPPHVSELRCLCTWGTWGLFPPACSSTRNRQGTPGLAVQGSSPHSCDLLQPGVPGAPGVPVAPCPLVLTGPGVLQTMVLASGGQDGAICLWDVLTGSRVSHMFAHRGDVTSLTCTTSCVISSGLDDVISIWDRSSGIKLYSIQQVGPVGQLGRVNQESRNCLGWKSPWRPQSTTTPLRCRGHH